MNYAQAKTAVALLERAAELVGRPVDELHLGNSRDIVRLDVGREDDEYDEGVEMVLSRGGRGIVLVVDYDGTVCGEQLGVMVEGVEVVLNDDDTFTWEEGANDSVAKTKELSHD